VVDNYDTVVVEEAEVGKRNAKAGEVGAVEAAPKKTAVYSALEVVGAMYNDGDMNPAVEAGLEVVYSATKA
jgi:hypothetical protein